jgi:hypothetical protein
MRSREPQSVADFCKEQARRITQRRFRWCLRAACAHVRRGRCGTTPGQAGGAGKPIGRTIRRRNARDRYRPRSTTTGVGVEALLHSDEGGLAVLPIQRGRCIAACSARRPFPRRGGRDAPYLEAARFSRRLIPPCASLACEADGTTQPTSVLSATAEMVGPHQWHPLERYSSREGLMDRPP